MKFQDDDFEVEWFSGTGGGGQHRNKHQNCCRILHKPTGIKAQGTSSKSRKENQRNAMSVCKSRVLQHLTTDTERYRASEERIRTYHEPDNRVIDHATGHTDTYKSVVLGPNIGEMLEERLKAKRITS